MTLKIKKTKKKKKDVYFTQETEKAVEQYRNKDTSEREKKRIYENILYPTFKKMIKILIHDGDFYYTGEDFESLVAEVEVHVWGVLNESNFDPELGRAYSYFTRTIINYLIQKQDSHQKMIDKYGLDSIDDDENYYIETYFEDEEEFDINRVKTEFSHWMEENIDDLFEFDDEIEIAHAILNILKADETGIEKKRHFFFAIEQQTRNKNNYKINKVLNVLKTYYFKMKDIYAKNLSISEFYEKY